MSSKNITGAQELLNNIIADRNTTRSEMVSAIRADDTSAADAKKAELQRHNDYLRGICEAFNAVGVSDEIDFSNL